MLNKNHFLHLIQSRSDLVPALPDYKAVGQAREGEPLRVGEPTRRFDRRLKRRRKIKIGSSSSWRVLGTEY